eukprot:7760392-Lingulodinium_polyedra.AAC.1
MRDLRACVASMMRVAGRGWHQALGWALQFARDPIKLACGTLKRWAKEWWQAIDPAIRDLDAMRPDELSK